MHDPSVLCVVVNLCVVSLFRNSGINILMSNLVGPGIAEGDENCKKFMEKTMPDAFQKVSGKAGSVICTCI